MKKVKLGIIGTGMAWERLHFPAYQKLMDKYDIQAVCDTNREKAQVAANALQLPESAVYTNHERMLDEAKLEAVDCMVPIAQNYTVAKDAISRGVHVIAEKPFAATSLEAKELTKLASKNKVHVLVAENFRYAEENQLIKKIIEERQIGNVAYFIDNNVTEFHSDMLDNNTFASREWRQHPEFKGGVFLDSAVHHFARQRFLFGNPRTLHAAGRPSDVDFSPYSCINAMITYENHITGHYTYFCIGKETQAPHVGLRIFGTHGQIYLESKDCGFVNVSLKDGTHQALPFAPEMGYQNELDNFYNALRFDEKIISTPEKELGDIQIIEAILDSCRRTKKAA